MPNLSTNTLQQYYKDTIEFIFDTRDEAKAFWKKYHGRTQRQMIEYVRDHNKRREPFTRVRDCPQSHFVPPQQQQMHQQQAQAHVHYQPQTGRQSAAMNVPAAEEAYAAEEVPLYSSAPLVGSAPGHQSRMPGSPPAMEPSTSVGGGGGYMMVCSNSEHDSVTANAGPPNMHHQSASTLGRAARPQPASLLRRPVPPSRATDTGTLPSTSRQVDSYAMVDKPVRQHQQMPQAHQHHRAQQQRHRPVVTTQLPSSHASGTYDNCLPEVFEYHDKRVGAGATTGDGDNVSQDSYQVSEVAEAELEAETADTEAAGATSSTSATSPPTVMPAAHGHVHVTAMQPPVIESVTTHVAAAVPQSQANYYGMKSVKSASAKIRELPLTPTTAGGVVTNGGETSHVIANGTSQIIEVTERVTSPRTYGATGPIPGRVVARSTAIVTPSGIRPMVQPVVHGTKPAVPPKPKQLVKVQAQSLDESLEEMLTDEEENEKITPVASPQAQPSSSQIQPQRVAMQKSSMKGATSGMPSKHQPQSPQSSTAAPTDSKSQQPTMTDSPTTAEPPAIHIQSEDRPEIQHRLLLNGDVPYVLHMRHVHAAANSQQSHGHSKTDNEDATSPNEFSTFKEPASRPTVQKAAAAISSQPTSPTQQPLSTPQSPPSADRIGAGISASASNTTRLSRADKPTAAAVTPEQVFRELTRRKSLDLVARRRLPSPNNFSSQDHSVSPTTPDTGNIMDYVLRKRTQSQDRMQVLQKATAPGAGANGRQRADPRRKTQPVKLAPREVQHQVDEAPMAVVLPPPLPPKPSLTSFGKLEAAHASNTMPNSSSQPELGTVPQGESIDYESADDTVTTATTQHLRHGTAAFPDDVDMPPPPPPLQSARAAAENDERSKEEGDLMWTDF